MKENKILISILVPTYNRVKYLEECLDSIIEQEWFDLKELELIVSDNSEWNETKNFMNGYIKKHKNRNIKYNKNEKNLWMVWNWNKLLELKKWEYFIFLSDDDKFYDKDSLKTIYNWLLKYKLDVCYWKYMLIDWNGHEKGICYWFDKIKSDNVYYDQFNEQLNFHTISFWGILYKDFWYQYNYHMDMVADRYMNLKYLYEKKHVWEINFFTFKYRNYDNNSIKKRNIKQVCMRRWYVYRDFHIKNPIAKSILFASIEIFCQTKLYKMIYSKRWFIENFKKFIWRIA